MARNGTLPEEVLARPRLDFAGKAVYAALAMSRDRRTGQCNPSHAALCGLLHTNETTLKRAMKKLLKEGEVIRHCEPGRQTWYELPRIQNDAPTPGVGDPSTQADTDPPVDYLCLYLGLYIH